MDDLTREQQKLLTSMYKEVLSRQPAVSFDEANYFANSDVVMDLFCPDSDSDHRKEKSRDISTENEVRE